VPEPGRQRQERLEAPSPRRRDRDPARVHAHRRQRPRRHPADPATRPRPAGRRPGRAAAQAARAGDRRPRLRLRQTPPTRARPRDHTRDRPTQHPARLRSWQRPLGRRAHLRAPAPIQAAARPLRTPRRDARSGSEPPPPDSNSYPQPTAEELARLGAEEQRYQEAIRPAPRSEPRVVARPGLGGGEALLLTAWRSGSGALCRQSDESGPDGGGGGGPSGPCAEQAQSHAYPGGTLNSVSGHTSPRARRSASTPRVQAATELRSAICFPERSPMMRRRSASRSRAVGLRPTRLSVRRCSTATGVPSCSTSELAIGASSSCSVPAPLWRPRRCPRSPLHTRTAPTSSAHRPQPPATSDTKAMLDR
jgi:hypothetical protein